LAYQVSAVFLLLSSLNWGNYATLKEGYKNVVIVTKPEALTHLKKPHPHAHPAVETTGQNESKSHSIGEARAVLLLF